VRSSLYFGVDVIGGAKAAINVVGAGASTALWAPLVESLPEALPLIAIAGAAGGLTRWIIDQSETRTPIWPNGAGTVLSGLMVAVFMFPMGRPISEWAVGQMNVDPSAGVMMGAYVTGLLGILLPMFILDVFGARRKRVVSEASKGDEVSDVAE